MTCATLRTRKASGDPAGRRVRRHCRMRIRSDRRHGVAAPAEAWTALVTLKALRHALSLCDEAGVADDATKGRLNVLLMNLVERCCAEQFSRLREHEAARAAVKH